MAAEPAQVAPQAPPKQAAEAETNEKESEEPVQEPPQAPPVPREEQLEFKRRLTKVTPVFQQALKDQHPNRGELEKTMKLVVAAGKSQDFEQGLKLLDKLEAGLK